jgi:hypothetical protein
VIKENTKVKSAFETTKEPSIWMTDKKAKRQNVAIKAATTELKNRGLKVRETFTEYTRAKASNGNN